ncbi:hypothetical protein LEL_09563 [Akanthomyces lecanii RCEF 1005]|uniref:2EXR domain-containing protein n=1 Tax=Akanthomyces lecanii RCEF 1005 TaxID=1081108 RepID=A0A162JM54_CORDF|nr:hypothetical protein LEL_09563 [Akanthomyces lecanii RCEF 1005]
MRPNGVTPSPSFTLFGQLPCELRLKIWHDALPESEGSAVYFFRDWKWKPHAPETAADAPSRPLLETDDELGEDVVNPHVPVYLPHISVNYEAREVALRWAARENLTLQLHERAWDEEHDAGGRVVVRPWQPRRGDAVYVGRDRWDDFCQRPCTFPFDGQAAVYYGTVDCGYAALSSTSPCAAAAASSGGLFGRPAPRSVEIRTLAIPAADVPGAALAGLLHCLPNLERLQLVYGPLPQPHEREDEALVPRRWALTSAHDEAAGVRPFHFTDAPMGGGRYAARADEAPLLGERLLKHVDDVEKMLLREVKRCEVESEARDAVEGDDSLPFTLEAVVLARGH